MACLGAVESPVIVARPLSCVFMVRDPSYRALSNGHLIASAVPTRHVRA
jgi:hypothetical protein